MKQAELERDARDKYSDEAIYRPETISESLFVAGVTFSSLLLEAKRSTLLPHIAKKRVLDIGCANGFHLSELADRIEIGIGVDFSLPFLRRAVQKFWNVGNIRFVLGDARALPLAAGSVDCAYSFATVYYVDDVDRLYSELRRVLVPGGIAVLEVGNSRSLSTLVSHQYPQIARHSRRTISEHLQALRRHAFVIEAWRSFQLLPMWGDRPDWIWILRLGNLERMLTNKVWTRTIDEWISSMPIVRHCAFRHLVVCRKLASVGNGSRR